MIERRGFGSVDIRGTTTDSANARVTFKPGRANGSMSVQTTRKALNSKSFGSTFVDQQSETKKVKFRNFFQNKQADVNSQANQKSTKEEKRVRDTLNGPMPDYKD